MDNYTKTLIRSFRAIDENLRSERRRLFPDGCPVTVACNRYHGPGVVVDNPECPADQIVVQIPNGNRWWYPLESATPIETHALVTSDESH